MALLSRFGDALHDIFDHANHRANRRHGNIHLFLHCRASHLLLYCLTPFHPVSPPTFAAGMSKNDMSEAVLASSIDAVSHSELLSYADYLYLCDVSDVVVFVYTLQRDQ